MRATRNVQGAWRPVTVRRGGLSAACSFHAAPGADSALLCMILTDAGHLEDPAGLDRAAGVVSSWLDRLSAAGANVLLVHGECFDDLWGLAAAVRGGDDRFARSVERTGMVVEHAASHGYGAPDRFVAMGVSRYGFASLRAMAEVPGISAAVAHQPVAWWPRLREFEGMDDNGVVLAHSLFEFTERLPPRPVLAQTGYNDQRLGQDWTERAMRHLADAYRAAGSPHGFTHERMDIPGHTDAPIPASAPDNVVDWMREHRLVEGGQDGRAFHPGSDGKR